jgi:hypothetical protein
MNARTQLTDIDAQTVAADALLVQARLEGDAALLPGFLQRLQAALPGTPIRLRAALSLTQNEVYAYLHFDRRMSFEKAAAKTLEAGLAQEFAGLRDIRVSRLEQLFASDGASAGSAPVLHYTVEMDPEAGWMPELSQWYDTEHMSGLAAVPGCVRVERYWNHDHGPKSLACYDLLSQETLVSPPWLAIRGTPWSDRMRPHFTNTIRTMFRCMAQAKA